MVRITYKTAIEYISIVSLLCLPMSGYPESKKEDKGQLTEDQIAGFHEAEERYKDNPAKMEILNQFKEKLGIPDKSEPEPPPPPPPKHILTTEGSMDSANAAYARGDYATALEQYKAMAAQGNPEANIYVGMMYEAGMGTEADMATAQAWYSRASETQTDYNHSKLVNDKTVKSYTDNRITSDEAAQSEIINQEINDEIARTRGEETTDYQAIEYSETATRSIVTGNVTESSYQFQPGTEEQMPMHAKSIPMQPRQQRKVLIAPQKGMVEHDKSVEHTEHLHLDKEVTEPELNSINKS